MCGSGRKTTFLPIALLLLAGACGKEEDRSPRFSPEPPPGSAEIVFAVHPLHNPARLLEIYGPIVDRLNAQIKEARFRLEASRNYEEFEKKLLDRRFHFALPNPYQTLRAMKCGYRVFGKMGDDQDFRGLILVRKDSGIMQVRDLRGGSVCYPAPTALAATMMPQYFLHSRGLDTNRDIRNVYVGSQESSIRNVYLRLSVAGATWPVPWKAFQIEHPAQAAELEVKWQTDSLLNNALVVREDIPPDLTAKVGDVLFVLHTHEEGRSLLQRIPLSRFEPASNRTYEPVRTFVRKFSAEVRPVETWDSP